MFEDQNWRFRLKIVIWDYHSGLGLGNEIWFRDWDQGLEIRDLDWGFCFGNGHWGLGFRIRIGIGLRYQELSIGIGIVDQVLKIGIGDCELGMWIGIGEWDWESVF